jgi:peptidoglycan/xylan/chitin deacetylase (PgdA/CDA1 family)
LHLLDLVRHHEGGRVPRDAAVLTFDDGYADNLHAAKPALVRHDVPATVFVSTGKIGQAREFWWDELDRLLLQPSVLPGTLELHAGGRTHRWELGSAAVVSAAELGSCRGRRPWDADRGTRLALYHAVYQVLQPLADETRDEMLARIATWSGAQPVARASHRTLSVAEMHALTEGGLVDVGAHTVSHAFLSTHSVAAQRHEIQESRRYLERELARPIESFAYPYGDCAPATVSLVREEFRCACSTRAAAVSRDSDRFRLPRFEVRDWDGDEFACHLRRWLRPWDGAPSGRSAS